MCGQALAAKHDHFKSGVLAHLAGILHPGAFAAG